jgi:hypothetical protein
METQLVNRYLRDNHCQYGVYLIGWFNCEQWDEADKRKAGTAKLDNDKLRDIQNKFDDQASQLSHRGIKVKAFVMDTALR